MIKYIKVQSQHNLFIGKFVVRLSIKDSLTCGYNDNVSFWYYYQYVKILKRFTYQGHWLRFVWYFEIGRYFDKKG